MYSCFRLFLLAFVISGLGCKSTTDNSDIAAVTESTSESGGDLTITSGKSGDIKILGVGNRMYGASEAYHNPSPPRTDFAHFQNVTVDGKWYNTTDYFRTLIPASRKNRAALMDLQKNRWEITQIVVDRARPPLPIYETMCSTTLVKNVHFLKSVSYVLKNQLITYTMEEVTEENLEDGRFARYAGGTNRRFDDDDLAKSCWAGFVSRYSSAKPQ